MRLRDSRQARAGKALRGWRVHTLELDDISAVPFAAAHGGDACSSARGLDSHCRSGAQGRHAAVQTREAARERAPGPVQAWQGLLGALERAVAGWRDLTGFRHHARGSRGGSTTGRQPMGSLRAGSEAGRSQPPPASGAPVRACTALDEPIFYRQAHTLNQIIFWRIVYPQSNSLGSASGRVLAAVRGRHACSPKAHLVRTRVHACMRVTFAPCVARGLLHVDGNAPGRTHPADTFLAMRGWGKVHPRTCICA